MKNTILAITLLVASTTVFAQTRTFNCTSKLRNVHLTQDLKNFVTTVTVDYFDTKETRTESAAMECKAVQATKICSSLSSSYAVQIKENVQGLTDLTLVDAQRADYTSLDNCVVVNH